MRVRKEEAIKRTQIYDGGFISEVRDEEWASAMEKTIENAFTNISLDGTTIEEYECKYTFCRIEATHEDNETADEFHTITKHIPGSFLIQRLHTNEDESTGSIAYFLRPEKEAQNIIYQQMRGRK